MRATIKYKVGESRKQKTMEVTKNEPNAIIREFAKSCKEIQSFTYITTVRCGRVEYQWFGCAKEAGV